ncbi:MAG TPA: SDR family oxidoreductase, partial [Jatrophihabitantaceae bacterium]|nr:SDR family oxidoreductase [Jatrophihabitantaceae bacterium]
MILVTGATGTVGSEVVKLLVAAGERTRAFVRDPAKGQLLGPQVERVLGDLDQPETIAAALADVERLFLVTTQSTRQPEWEWGVIEAAASAGVRRVVKLSVFNADEHSPLQVARQHWQAEHALEESGLAATILRPVFFMQNLLAMVRGDRIATAAGQGRVAMIDARDIAAVAVAALTREGHAGKTYTLTGSEALSFDDVARIISQRTGKQISHFEAVPDGVRAALQAAGVPAWFASDMATLQGMLADGYEDVTTDDVRSVTGSPPRTLDQFAADFADSL